MKTITTSFNIYEFNELDEKAKQRVRKQFAEWKIETETDNLIYDYQEILDNHFPESELDYQFSFHCCQGDGINFYGRLNGKDAFRFMNEHNLFNDLSSKEYKRMKHYLYEGTRYIEIESNRRYSYNKVHDMTLFYNVMDSLESLSYRNIDETLIRKMSTRFSDTWAEWLKELETHGYENLYEFTDDDIVEDSMANGYGFLRNGKEYYF